ncbi:MAG: hydroxyisourate hydrolase [Oceanospirillaceae bacterium]|nr:hydroxyisourate hydrolase [Oceanospirillaceae bacterium]
MGFLSTHVLDTANGLPGHNIPISLYSVSKGEGNNESKLLLGTYTTNSDGRCDHALLEGDAFKVGVYELVFSVASYYRERGMQLPEPAFLDEVVLRFGISDAQEHYHVPLLISPYSYSTYRGS